MLANKTLQQAEQAVSRTGQPLAAPVTTRPSESVSHRVQGMHVLRDVLCLISSYFFLLGFDGMLLAIPFIAKYPVIIGLLYPVQCIVACAVVAGWGKQSRRARALRMLWGALNVSALLAVFGILIGEKGIGFALFGANLLVSAAGYALSLRLVPPKSHPVARL